MSDDCVSRQAALDNAYRIDLHDTGNAVVLNVIDVDVIKALPSAEPESCDMCDFCDELESGDKLFQISDWDGGIGFDYIYIKYCPMCGRRL